MTIYEESVMLKHAAIELLIGKEIGEGGFRRVYELKQEPENVLKIQFASGFHNVIEWETWQAAEGTPWEKWFAPCDRIDSWGGALVQRKAETFDSETDFLRRVKKVPLFFHDVKWTNWGLLDGRPVCFDYGHTLLFQNGLDASTGALKKTKGWAIP